MIISFSVIISRRDTTFALFLATSIIIAKIKLKNNAEQNIMNKRF